MLLNVLAIILPAISLLFLLVGSLIIPKENKKFKKLFYVLAFISIIIWIMIFLIFSDINSFLKIIYGTFGWGIFGFLPALLSLISFIVARKIQNKTLKGGFYILSLILLTFFIFFWIVLFIGF